MYLSYFAGATGGVVFWPIFDGLKIRGYTMMMVRKTTPIRTATTSIFLLKPDFTCGPWLDFDDMKTP